VKRVPAPNEEGLCAYCMWPMQGDQVWFNGCLAHCRCAAEHEALILGDDAGPGLLEHLDAMEERAAFIERLGREAAALGLDYQLLAQAVIRASSNAES
jgi:hypothetical protein